MNDTMHDPHLVPLDPSGWTHVRCPACGSSDVDTSGVVTPGIHMMGDHSCRSCGYEFLLDLPVGFGVQHPMAIGRSDGRLHNPGDGGAWIHGPLLEGFRAPDDRPVRIERIVHRECREVVFLNTLDFLYGHVLLKLFNAHHYLEERPDLGLVLLVPRMFAWMVPEGVAEAWLVDLKLSQLHGWYTDLDRQVREGLAGFGTVFFGKGYAHPDHVPIDIARFTGQQPFPMERFLEEPPHVTFIAREDRLWFRSPLSKFLFRATHPLGLRKLLARLWVSDQDRLMRGTMKAIRREFPGVSFTVAGLGRPGGFGGLAEDLRTLQMDEATERRWCAAYGRSQFVIGLHGSNMLLPTAHAGGCIEVLPYDRYENFVQDVAVRYADVMQLFLYRFVDEFATPRQVARHALSMFRDFRTYYRNNRTNVF